MKRKNFEPSAEDMSFVVALHNSVNEKGWNKILQWEAKYAQTCAQPKLKRFEGKPDQLSPKARFLNLFGYEAPFDRHDWVVDRCGQGSHPRLFLYS